MKKYLVTLNHSVLIRVEDTPKPIYKNIYGFVANFAENDDAQNEETQHNIHYYVGYLAAMSEWSLNPKDFTIDFSRNSPDWKDRSGKIHTHLDDWMVNIEKKAVKKLNLDYTLRVIDLDGKDDKFADCLACGTNNSNIICSKLMDRLVRITEEQEETNPYIVALFNRPIFLPKKQIWKDETGFCHLYGLIYPEKYRDQFYTDDDYLAYLALNELYVLNGETPSGYTLSAQNNYCWEDKEGYVYGNKSDKILEESRLCKEQLNLKINRIVLHTPWKKVAEGVRNGYIIDQGLYESLLEAIKEKE